MIYITISIYRGSTSGHTHIHTYQYRRQKQFQETSCTPAKGQQVKSQLECAIVA